MSDNIIYLKSSTDKIQEYIGFYNRCFPPSDHFNYDYLEWLYKKNPNGSMIGIDAYLNGELIGQVASIPVNYYMNNNISKGLLALNVAVDPRMQGRGLFKKLGLKMCDYGRQEHFNFVIGVANKAATPGWVRQMGFHFIGPLFAYIGVGKYLKNYNKNQILFRRFWDANSLAWRINSPINKIDLVNGTKWRFFKSRTGIPFIRAFSQHLFDNDKPHILIKFKFNFSLNLVLGLFPSNHSKFCWYIPIPNYFKPSPLNLIFLDLNDATNVPSKDDLIFDFMDFDAY